VAANYGQYNAHGVREQAEVATGAGKLAKASDKCYTKGSKYGDMGIFVRNLEEGGAAHKYVRLPVAHGLVPIWCPLFHSSCKEYDILTCSRDHIHVYQIL